MTVTKNLTKAELTLRSTPTKMDASLQEETDSCWGKKKKKEITLKMRETGKEKVQKYKKWPSQKESIW